MFINLKINLKILIIMLIVLFTILSFYGGYLIISKMYTYDNISMNTSNFTNILKEVYNNPYTYENKTINVSGYVFIPDTLNDKEFVIARNMIVCCETEPFVVGFLCKTNEKKFEKNTWLNIKGIIKIENGAPYIDVTNAYKAFTPNKDTVSPPTI